MVLNQNYQEIAGLDFALLDNIDDEVMYIGPDNKIKWLNKSAKKTPDNTRKQPLS